jgi:hypothetical protein
MKKKIFSLCFYFRLYWIFPPSTFMIRGFCNEKLYPAWWQLSAYARRLRLLVKQCNISQLPAFRDENFPKDKFWKGGLKPPQELSKVYIINSKFVLSDFRIQNFNIFHFYSAKWLNIRIRCNETKIFGQLSSPGESVNKAKRRECRCWKQPSLTIARNLSIHQELENQERIPPLAYSKIFPLYVQILKGKFVEYTRINYRSPISIRKEDAYVCTTGTYEKIYNTQYPSISVYGRRSNLPKRSFEYFDFWNPESIRKSRKPRFSSIRSKQSYKTLAKINKHWTILFQNKYTNNQYSFGHYLRQLITK